MGNRSAYDELHDQYHEIATSKKGTRYEVLAAFVLKSLDRDSVVIHDLDLRGESNVDHQIDVTVEVGGETQRILIECKDFDISGDNVGLGIVRDFWGVVDDINPDRAIVLTCNGYSNDAVRFAENKGIKLGVLREFDDEDSEGYVNNIGIKFKLSSITDRKVGLDFPSDEARRACQENLDSLGIDTEGKVNWGEYPVYLTDGGSKEAFAEVLEKERQQGSEEALSGDRFKVDLPLNSYSLIIDDGDPIPLSDGSISYRIEKGPEEYFEVAGLATAELILEGLDEDPVWVWDNDLKEWKVAKETGKIVEDDRD